MRAWWIVIAALLLAGSSVLLPARGRAVARTAQPVLLAVPYAVHPGGIIYASGSNFPPRSQVSVLLFCQNGSNTQVLVSRKASTVTTDAAGSFVAFALRPIAPVYAANHTCRVEAAADTRTETGEISALVKVFASTRTLPHCATHMCLHVTAHLVRLQSKTQGTVVVTGWPGAQVKVTITGPGIKPIVRYAHLNWRGVGSVRATVSLGLLRGVTRHAWVVAHFKGVSGSGNAPFSVVPGGR